MLTPIICCLGSPRNRNPKLAAGLLCLLDWG